jgi:hypothetical protein
VLAVQVAQAHGRLLSVWGRHGSDGASACAAFATTEGLLWAELPLAGAEDRYPDLSATFACATRMQRSLADLGGLQADAAVDHRPWLDHGLWAAAAPLASGMTPAGAAAGTWPADYPFVRVEGDGVHEIAVGPVHAGIIEPGHFRFSVVGEKVLRLEQHLGYTHKGHERRFTEPALLQAFRWPGACRAIRRWFMPGPRDGARICCGTAVPRRATGCAL